MRPEKPALTQKGGPGHLSELLAGSVTISLFLLRRIGFIILPRRG